MPRPKEAEPLVKVKVNLFERDYLRLKDLHTGLGATVAIRKLVRAYIEKVDRKIAPLEELDLEIELTEEEIAAGT